MTTKEIDEVLANWSIGGQPKWIVSRLQAVLKEREKVAMVLAELEDICPVCYDGDRDCQCWNDE